MPKPGRTTPCLRARPPAAGALILGLLTALAVVTAAPASGQDRQGSGTGQSSAWQEQQAGHRQRPAHAPYRKTREDRVEAVLRAARSQLGTPYRYGGTSPSSGFDCSGFTRWAWAHGGVSLPHNSAQQYSAVPWHVHRGHLQPGDLLFFYSPISHVAIFLGGNRMIEAPHTGEHIRIVQIYWPSFSAAARPA